MSNRRVVDVRLPYQPQEKQKFLHASPARQILFGGAAGGGKSVALRWDAVVWCSRIPGLQAYLFRRSMGELYDNHIKWLKAEIPSALAKWNETRKVLEFKNGSALEACYCEREDDVLRYQGAEIHYLAVDEAAHLTEWQMSYLTTRVRLGSFAVKIPERFRKFFPRIVFASNPGGPGHNYLKDKFLAGRAPMEVFHDKSLSDPRYPDDPGWPSVFIPARMEDNAHLDATYSGQFNALPPELARALREGDWDAVVGQAVPAARERHMIRAFRPPRHWTRFMAMDWGSAAPFSLGWYCVSDGDAVLEGRDGWPDVFLPAGAVIRYAEHYGWNGKANQGCRMTAADVGRLIVRIEAERDEPPMDYRVADWQCWATDDGPSVIENMQAADPRLVFQQSQKDRKAGYAEILGRLADAEGDFAGEAHVSPMFFVTADCRHWWRTVPVLTFDTADPEKGPDTRQENHAYDETAYALRSRPFVTTELDRDIADYSATRKRIRHFRGRGRMGTKRRAA